MTSIDDDSDWTMVIRSRKGWFDIDISEIWRYRDLAFADMGHFVYFMKINPKNCDATSMIKHSRIV